MILRKCSASAKMVHSAEYDASLVCKERQFKALEALACLLLLCAVAWGVFDAWVGLLKLDRHVLLMVVLILWARTYDLRLRHIMSIKGEAQRLAAIASNSLADSGGGAAGGQDELLRSGPCR